MGYCFAFFFFCANLFSDLSILWIPVRCFFVLGGKGRGLKLLWAILGETRVKEKQCILQKYRPESLHFLILALHLRVFQKFLIFLGSKHQIKTVWAIFEWLVDGQFYIGRGMAGNLYLNLNLNHKNLIFRS